MTRESLPPELRELEGRLRGRLNAEPPAELRSRILRGISADLSMPTQATFRRSNDAHHWAAIAAAAIIAVNLSAIDRSRTEFSGDCRIGQGVGNILDAVVVWPNRLFSCGRGSKNHPILQDDAFSNSWDEFCFVILLVAEFVDYSEFFHSITISGAVVQNSPLHPCGR